MKKFLLSLCVMMLTCLGTWAQYSITYNGTSATITEESPGQSLEVIISDINTNHSDVVNFSLPSSWTKEQVNTFAQGVTNKKSISKDTYGTVDVWSYIDPKTSASTSYTGTVYAGSAIGKSGDYYGKLNSYQVVPTAENISYVKSVSGEVYTVSPTTPILYQGGSEYGVAGSLVDLYAAYMYNGEKYTGELMALEGGNAYGNTGNAVEVTTANVPYTYNAAGLDYVYLSGDVYTSAGKKYYLPTAGDIVGLTISTIYKTYSTSESAAVFSGTEDDIDLEHMYDPWGDGILCYYAKNDEGHTVPIYPVTSYTYGDGVKYTGVIYEKEGAKYGYTGSDAHELTAVNTSLTYETSTNKVYTGRLYKDASDNTVGGDGTDITLTTALFTDEACTKEYTGPTTEDNKKGAGVTVLLSKSYTYTYTDLTGTEHTSDPFASKQTQINLSGDELYIEVANNPIPAKTSSELIVYTTAEGELQALIDAMTPEEKSAIQTIAINGVISYADATSLSNLTSAKVFDVTNATGSLGSINVSGVVVASDAAAITTRNNLTAVVTPVDATTVDVVKGSASTIDAEALEMALAGKQTANVKNPNVDSYDKVADLIDRLPSNITSVSIAEDRFGANQTNIIVSNTNITEFDASNVRGAYAKLTLDLSACTGLTTVNLVNSLLPESENVIGTLTLPNKPLIVMCTAAEKAQVKKLLGGDDSNITYVVPAVKLAVSIADGLSVNHDKTIELSVIESAITVEATGYDALVKGTDYSLVVKQNGTVVPAEGLEASTFDNGEHSVSSIPFTVEVTSLNSDLYTDADVANGSIALTHKKSFTLALSFADDKTEISANSSETAQINATSKDTESEAAINVEYTYKSSDESVATVNTTTGLVTAVRGSSDPVIFTVTATPTGDDAANYAPMTETISINVTQSWVTLSKETIDGKEFVVVYVPLGGAFGPLSDTPTTVEENGATLAELKAAANVKVTGNISNSDVRELVNLIGSWVQSESDFANCEILDMGEATMTEAVTSDETTFKCSWVSTSNSKSLASVKELTLPRPTTDESVENGTVLPSYTGSLFTSWNTNSLNSLESLTIPEGWTKISDTFSNYHNTGETTFQKLTTLNLPNSVTYIGKYAFSDTHAKVLYMPNKLEVIEEYAFCPSSILQDIYFTGPAPREVAHNAFSTQTQMANNTCADKDFEGQNLPLATRENYTNGGVYACIMHYPAEYKSDYIDETRVYTVIQEEGFAYNKGNTVNGTSFVPHGVKADGTTPWEWSSDFKTTVNAASPDWDMDTHYVDGAYPDLTYGMSFVWPSQAMMTSGFSIANAGYHWDTTPMTEAEYKKRGLYQFIVAMPNAPTSTTEWVFPGDYEQDKWYTIALPFNLSVDEIKNIFGEETQVCRFSSVTRDIESAQKVLRLEFRKSVMKPGGYSSADNISVNFTTTITGYDSVTGKPTTTATHNYANDETTGIVHHVPYMIKPSGSVEDNEDAYKILLEDASGTPIYKRMLPNYEAIPGILYSDDVTATDRTNYNFRPILMEGKYKKNSYVFTKNTKNDNHHEFVFYKGKKNADGTYVDGGKATAYTGYVQLNHGEADLAALFATTGAGSTNAPIYTSLFGDEEDATAIEKIEIVCGNDKVEECEVYTINGVLMNGNNLPAGLYIKNGKKFIVK